MEVALGFTYSVRGDIDHICLAKGEGSSLAENLGVEIAKLFYPLYLGRIIYPHIPSILAMI